MTSRLSHARTAAGEVGLRALLARPAEAVLAFDFDGTLAPIVTDPEHARAHPGAVPALRRLAPNVARVAVITGRPARVAVEHGGFAGLSGLSGLVIAGHYGLERWESDSDTVITPDPHPGVDQVRTAVPGVLEAALAPVGTTVEDKGHSMAVHVRRTADPTAAMDLLRGPLGRLAHDAGLVVEPGRMVLELRPAGMHKGAALRDIVTAAGARCVLFAGDDLGDLPAFDAVDELRAEGLTGVLVGAGSTEVDAVADRADLVVDGPAGVVGLLAALANQLTDATG